MGEVRPHSSPDIKLKRTDWRAADMPAPSLAGEHRKAASASRLIEVGGDGGFKRRERLITGGQARRQVEERWKEMAGDGPMNKTEANKTED